MQFEAKLILIVFILMVIITLAIFFGHPIDTRGLSCNTNYSEFTILGNSTHFGLRNMTRICG
jgi:hypothetical protein